MHETTSFMKNIKSHAIEDDMNMFKQEELCQNFRPTLKHVFRANQSHNMVKHSKKVNIA